MLRVKDIIISESTPNDPKVGWVTTVNGKPTLRFNINGVWKDMIEKPDDPEEDIDSHYRILVGPVGGLWLLSIYGDADLNNDDQITDMTVVYFSTEEGLMKWKFVTGYTVGQYKALTGETISNKIDFDDLHQFQLYIDSDLISSAKYGQLEDTDTLVEILQRLWGNSGEGSVRQFTDDYGNIYNVSKVVDNNTISVVKYIPEEQWVTFLFGSSVDFSNNAAIIAAGSGSKLLQLTFIKTGEGVAYEVYVSVLGENF